MHSRKSLYNSFNQYHDPRRYNFNSVPDSNSLPPELTFLNYPMNHHSTADRDAEPNKDVPILNLGLNTAAEIAKWRQERKRNYPTLKRIQQRGINRSKSSIKGFISDRKKNKFNSIMKKFFDKETDSQAQIINQCISFIVKNNFFID